MTLWRSALGAARELALPARCVCCGRPGAWWCDPCVATIPPLPPQAPIAGVPFTPAVAYEGAARELLLALKDRHISAAAEPLGRLLGRVLPPDGPPLVPVPATTRSWLERGFDPLELILAGTAGARVRRSLAWQGRRRPQKSLDRADRRRNVAGALRVRTPPSGPVLVVDDVITTGATVTEAVVTLRTAGIEVAGIVGVCSVADPWEHAAGLRVSVKHEAEGPSGSSVRSVARPGSRREVEEGS